ncbi:MAG TPA: phosphate acyltransferase PlsX [Planctomycetaceae bacterium]|nr:phosphate acyltransferase PlsX [Planctomycetaceae bacterium]
MRIALDAMGGDHAPAPNLDGALAALKSNPGLEIHLVGDESQLAPLLEQADSALVSRLQLVHCNEVVGMDEKPTDALRKKPNNSISVCWRLMAEKNVDAIVSAGNTGAVVAAGLRTRLFLKGVKRPGIAVTLPTVRGRSILMDVGANPAARPEHLLQYAIIGGIYAREMLEIPAPRIGLMNIGSEEGKGNDLYRETHQLLMQSGLNGRYVGNVEGRGLYQGEADVLVCEGFVGNVVLKVSEGMAEFLMKAVAQAVLGKLDQEREIATLAFHNLARSYQYKEAGGAPLLGIDGICIICHGSSDARAIENALRVAETQKDRNLNSQITEELSNVPLPRD